MAQGAGTAYSYSQLLSLWVNNGGSILEAPFAAAVAIAESGGCSSGGCFAYSAASGTNGNGTTDTGLWQVNSSNVPAGMDPTDPNTNAALAVGLAGNSLGWNNWSVVCPSGPAQTCGTGYSTRLQNVLNSLGVQGGNIPPNSSSGGGLGSVGSAPASYSSAPAPVSSQTVLMVAALAGVILIIVAIGSAAKKAPAAK